MKVAWTILIISVITDVLVAGGGSISAAYAQAKGEALNWHAVGWAFGTAVLIGLRTIQQEFKAVGLKLSDILRQELKEHGGYLPPPGDSA